MSEQKFTPGPWRYQESSDAYTHIVRALEHYFVCQLPQDTSGTAEANARLIAAAPDMLAALREARAFMMAPAEDLLWSVIGRLDAAISKAEAVSP